MLLFDRIYRGASDKVEFTGKLPSKACCLLEVTCTDSRYDDFEGKNSIRHAHLNRSLHTSKIERLGEIF